MLGRHWLGEARGCPPERLADHEGVARLLVDLADRAGLTALGAPTVESQPDGVVGMVLLAESHASVHTVPAEGVAFVDLFSCADFDDAVVVATVQAALRPDRLDTRSVPRGEP